MSAQKPNKALYSQGIRFGVALFPGLFFPEIYIQIIENDTVNTSFFFFFFEKDSYVAKTSLLRSTLSFVSLSK